jgi:hypothetical protein
MEKMMIKILTVIVLALKIDSSSHGQVLMQDAIRQPVMGVRCKELFKERAEKIKFQQRLNGLLQRSVDLSKKTPDNKTGINARIKANEIEIKNELHLANLQIKTMEENIVRSGCPGLSL